MTDNNPVGDVLTARARTVLLTKAKNEALIHKHNYIGTEHILLAIIDESDCVAAKVIVKHGIELRNLRTVVEIIIRGRGSMEVSGDIPYTRNSKKVIEYALDEMRRMDNKYLTTGHILLGIIRGSGVAVGVLESMGLSLQSVWPMVSEEQNQKPV